MVTKKKATPAAELLGEFQVLAVRAVREAVEQAKYEMPETIKAEITDRLRAMVGSAIEKRAGWRYGSSFTPDPASPIGRRMEAAVDVILKDVDALIAMWEREPTKHAVAELRRRFDRAVEHAVASRIQKAAEACADAIIAGLLGDSSKSKGG